MKYLLTQGLGFGVVVGGFNLLIVYIDNDEKTVAFDEVVFKAILIIASAAIIYALVSWPINNFIYMKLK